MQADALAARGWRVERLLDERRLGALALLGDQVEPFGQLVATDRMV